MIEIPHMVRTMSHAECVLYEDHVAAMQAAYPQAKFKVGDRVLWGKDLGTVTEPERESDRVAVSWDDGDYSTVRLSDLTLYAPPATTCGCPGGYVKKALTPAELIPTLKEHEWVRLTTTYNEKPFEGTVFFAHGAIMVGLNILAPNDSPPNPSITSIERCDPPEVK
jgi:hypothetical protein